jgi:hypothetical protein
MIEPGTGLTRALKVGAIFSGSENRTVLDANR